MADTCISIGAGYPALLNKAHKIPNVLAEQSPTIPIRCNQAFHWVFFNALNSLNEIMDTYIVLAKRR